MNETLLNCFKSVQGSSAETALDRPTDGMGPGTGCIDGNLIRIHDADGWSDDSSQNLIDEGWIQKNWQNEYERSLHGVRKDFCDCLAAFDGPILEIAAGPGGGNFPAVLQRNPQSSIIVNDISAKVLELWQEFLDQTQEYRNVILAAFDARLYAIKYSCIEAISSVAGLSETHGPNEVLQQCHRMLRPGGHLYCFEHIISSKDWHRLPENVRLKWEAQTPQMLSGYAKTIESNGFQIARHETKDGRILKHDEGSLASDAWRFGVELSTKREWIEAIRME